MNAGQTTIAVAELERVIASALEKSGTSAANAASVARALALAEIDGQQGHGLSRVPSYAAQVRAGKVAGKAEAGFTRLKSGVLRVDAGHGFAFPAFDLAVAQLPAMAREQGIALAGIVRSHHAGALGLVAERIAAAGALALVFANTPSAMAAWGGRRGVVGTNPIAFAAPRRAEAPLVVDLALSEVARGKILASAQKGEPIPQGWAVDEHGQPTTDAKAALKGMLLPAGGAKGAALALMVEVLAATVTGSRLAFEASSFLDADGGPPDVGQLIVAIDTGSMLPPGEFLDRFEVLADAVAGSGARLPGSRRIERREQAQRAGVAVDVRLLAAVQALGA